MFSEKREKRVCLLAILFGLAVLGLSEFAWGDTYSYDTHGRLVSVTYSNGSTVTYTYDAAGNRITVSQTP